mmetsp:Transcript_15727/g.48750  ORF Transcript_15727/g.48750 Transcript_15727/m.48750 type:complete len:233 (-) Transcript_15727:201-899(-)
MAAGAGGVGRQFVRLERGRRAPPRVGGVRPHLAGVCQRFRPVRQHAVDAQAAVVAGAPQRLGRQAGRRELKAHGVTTRRGELLCVDPQGAAGLQRHLERRVAAGDDVREQKRAAGEDVVAGGALPIVVVDGEGDVLRELEVVVDGDRRLPRWVQIVADRLGAPDVAADGDPGPLQGVDDDVRVALRQQVHVREPRRGEEELHARRRRVLHARAARTGAAGGGEGRRARVLGR